jgi:hypothetical protein
MIFVLFLSQVRKHHTLALFSTVPLHRIQAMMDLRQTLEAGACAAYAIANTDPADFADKDQDRILNPTQDLARKRYKWLEQNFSVGSNAIKRIKESINKSAAHSNIADAHLNFSPFEQVLGSRTASRSTARDSTYSCGQIGGHANVPRHPGRLESSQPADERDRTLNFLVVRASS